MTGVSVVIAYRDLGDPHRAASFDFVREWYFRLGWQVVVEAGVDRFSRAAAINAAVRASSGEVIVQSDPDSLVSEANLRAAILLAARADGLVIPHDRYLYLAEAPTLAVLNDMCDPFAVGEDDCDESGVDGAGNVVVFSRRTWEAAGGFDERFGMWGGDDAAFRYACDAIVAPTRRIPGDVVHLWHPRLPQSIPGGPGYAEQFAILAEYRDAAAASRDAVRALVESRRSR